MSQPSPAHGKKQKVVIVGGGTGGIVAAARLRRAGVDRITVVEPSGSHYYQPLWTLVGGGRCPAATTVRPEARVMPKGVTWVREAATGVDPAAQAVTTPSGQLHYDYLVMAPGIQLDFGKVPGLAEGLGPAGYLQQLPLRPRPADLGVHPRPARGDRPVHHASGADQMRGCWRPATSRP